MGRRQLNSWPSWLSSAHHSDCPAARDFPSACPAGQAEGKSLAAGQSLWCALLSQEGQLFSCRLPNLEALQLSGPQSPAGAGPQPLRLHASKMPTPDNYPAGVRGGGLLHYSLQSGLLAASLKTLHGNTTVLMQLSGPVLSVVRSSTVETELHTGSGFVSLGANINTATAIPALQHFFEVPLLPAARLKLNTPSLLCCAPAVPRAASIPQSHTACLIALALQQQSSASTAAGAVMQAVRFKSSADGYLEGVAVMLCPVSSQTIVVAMCSRGNLYFFQTAKIPNLMPLEPFTTSLNSQFKVDADAAAAQTSTAVSPLSARPGGASAASGPSSPASPAQQAATATASQGSSRRRFVSHRVAAAQRTSQQENASDDSGSDGEGEDAPSSAAEQKFLVYVFEGATVATADLKVSGDVQHVGGSEVSENPSKTHSQSRTERLLLSLLSSDCFDCLIKAAPNKNNTLTQPTSS